MEARLIVVGRRKSIAYVCVVAGMDKDEIREDT